MTIDAAYQFVNYIANKKQSGQIRPKDFNILAPQAQMQAIMNAFGNPRTYSNGRPIPIMGHSMTIKTQDNLMPLLKKYFSSKRPCGVWTYLLVVTRLTVDSCISISSATSRKTKGLR